TTDSLRIASFPSRSPSFTESARHGPFREKIHKRERPSAPRTRQRPVPGTTGDGGNTRSGCGPAEKTETIERRETNKRRSSSCRSKVAARPAHIKRAPEGLGTLPGFPSEGLGTLPGFPSEGLGTLPGFPSEGLGTLPGFPS